MTTNPHPDTARLDWLEKMAALGHAEDRCHDVMICGPGNHGGSHLDYLVTVEEMNKIRPFIEAFGPSLRSAIDTAKQQTEGGKE